MAEDGSNEISPDELEAVAGSSQFSVYDDIKAKLVARGVPAHEIAFIHDYNTPKQKQELFKRVNRGDIRFLFGSTPKLGAGTNVQERLVGLHHIDAPWRPSDLEQREGRIIRQGNQLFERDPDGFKVFIGRYATEQTYDTRRWQLLEHKAAGIEQLRKYSGEAEMDDVASEAANAADMKAAASGNPLILEETKLSQEVRKLTLLRKAFNDATYSLRFSIKSWEKFRDETLPGLIEYYQAKEAIVSRHPLPKDSKAVAELYIGGKKQSSKAQAVAMFTSAIAKVHGTHGQHVAIAYRGLDFELVAGLYGTALQFDGKDISNWGASGAISPSGLLTRLNNFTSSFGERIENAQHEVVETGKRIEDAQQILAKPFEYESELDNAIIKHKDVQRQLMKASQLDAVPQDKHEEFNRALADRKQALVKLGYGDAVREATLETSNDGNLYSKAVEATDEDSAIAPGMALPPASMQSMAFAHEVLTELAGVDELFRYPISQRTTLQGVMRDIAPNFTFVGDDTRMDERQESGADKRLMFKTNKGKPFYIYERGDEIWLDVSHLEPGDRGSAIYAAVGNYAHNTGKVFIGDPEGLSDDAVIRRTANMLSLALRFGTTDFMEPSIEQKQGIKKLGVIPLKWSGNDVDKTKSLIYTFLSNLQNQLPEIKNVRYDFARRAFVGRDDLPVDWGRFESARRRGLGATARAGEATARRGAFIQSLISSPNGARPGLLENALRGAAGLVQQGGLSRLFSKATKTNPKSTQAELEAAVPARVKPMLASGKLRVVQSDPSGAQAFYNAATDTITLVADNLSVKSLLKVLAHELFHRALATDPRLRAAYSHFKSILQKRFNLAKDGKATPAENAAAQRVLDANTKEEHQAEEFGGYLVEAYQQKPDSLVDFIRKAIRDFIAAIRIALIRAGLTFNNIATADLAAMAQYGLRVNAPSPVVGHSVFASTKGNWRQTHQPPVPLVELTGHEIQGKNPAEGRENARAFVDRLIQTLIDESGADTIRNTRTGFDIRLTKKGVVHGFQHHGPQHIKAVAAIRQLIENAASIAVFDHVPENTKWKAVHTLVAPLKIGNNYYAVKLTVKESADGGFRLYDHEALEMAKPDGIYEPPFSYASNNTNTEKSKFRPAPGLVISVPQMLSAFKGDNAKYLAPKSVDENNNSPDDLRYSIGDTLRNAMGRDTPVTNLSDIDHILATGKMPQEYPNRQMIHDKAITLLVDSSRPFDAWTRALPDMEKSGQLILAKDRAKTRAADMEKEALDKFLKPLAAKIEKIAKATKMDYPAAKEAIGQWLTVRYAIPKNQDFIRQDAEAVQNAENDLLAKETQDQIDLAAGKIAQLPSNSTLKAAITRTKTDQAKRLATINEPRIIDPTTETLAAGLAGGYNTFTARHYLGEIEKKIPNADLNAAAQHIYDMLAWKAQRDLQNGKVTAAQMQHWFKHPHYVPLTGDPSADTAADPLFDSPFAHGGINQQSDKQAKGRKRSIAQNGIDAATEQVQKSARYHGWVDFKDTFTDIYDSLIAEEIANGLTQREAQHAVRDHYGISRSPEAAMTIPSGTGLIIRKNGQNWVYDIGDQGAMDALRSINREDTPSLLQPVAAFTRTYARLVTQFLPGFAPVNALRDTWERSENIRTRKIAGYTHLDMNKIGGHALKNAADPRTLRKLLGVMLENTGAGQLFKVDNTDPDVQMIREMLKEGGASTWGEYINHTSAGLSKQMQQSLHLTAKANDIVKGYNNGFELISSFSIYKALRQNGVDAKTAASTTLNMMNFGKSGTITGPLKALYAFVNPVAQGAHQMGMTLATPHGQARAAAYLIAGMMLYAMLRAGDDDDELGVNRMDQLGNYTLERNIPLPIGGNDYLKLPVGFGMPQLMWAIAVNAVKAMAGEQTAADAGAEILKNIARSMAPVQPSETSISHHPVIWLTQTFAPQIIKPLMDVALDVNAFGSPLTNAKFNKADMAVALQGRPSTPEMYHLIAAELAKLGIQAYPEQVREMMRGYAVGPFNEIIKAMIENPHKQAMGRDTISPLLDRWVARQDRSQLKEWLYYRQRGQINEAAAKASLGEPLNAREKTLAAFNAHVKRQESRINGKFAAAAKQEKITHTPSPYRKQAELLRKHLENQVLAKFKTLQP